MEEQYYIIFPIFFLAIYKWYRQHTITILTAALIISLLFAELMTTKDSSFSFYMLPSRFWELLAGALLANILYFHPREDNDTLLEKTMPVVGLYLIIHSVVFIDFDSAKHPGVITLVPVVGTMLIIWFARKGELVTQLLSSRAFVSIGLISYSLYLWHYPIFSFFRIEGFFDTSWKKILAIGLTVFLSVLSTSYIESRFRSKSRVTNRLFWLINVITVFLITTISILFITKDGVPQRMPEGIYLSTKEMEEYRRKYWSDKSAFTKSSEFSPAQISVYVIGNSWAQDIANSLGESGKLQVGYDGSTSHLCKAITLNRLPAKHKDFEKYNDRCPANISRFKKKLPNTNLVIIADNNTLDRVSDKTITVETLSNIRTLKKHGYDGPILIISNRPRYSKPVFEIVKQIGSTGNGTNILAQKYLSKPLSSMRNNDSQAQRFYESKGIYYYSLVDSFCKEDICKIVDNHKPLYHDRGHLTLSGAIYIAKDLTTLIENEILSVD